MHFHHYSADKQEYCSGKALIQFVIAAASLYVLPALLLFCTCLLAVFPLLRLAKHSPLYMYTVLILLGYIPYPRERGPMGGAPYIGPRLGGGRYSRYQWRI